MHKKTFDAIYVEYTCELWSEKDGTYVWIKSTKQFSVLQWVLQILLCYYWYFLELIMQAASWYHVHKWPSSLTIHT